MKNRTFIALLRGILLAALLFVIQAVTDVLGGDLPPALDAYKPWIPVVIIALRSLEGLVDQYKKGDEPANRNTLGV